MVQLARDLKKAPISDALKDRVVGLLFMNPSLRTLASFQTGIAQLGGTSVVIQPGVSSWGLEFEDGTVMDGTAAEHVKEAIPVLASYFDYLGIRNFAKQQDILDDLGDVEMRKLAKLSTKPLINMESASDHPCQALADWMTLDEQEIPADGTLVLSWAWHPKPLPYAVPRAALNMAAQRGMRVVVHCPKGYELPDSMLNEARELNGDRVETIHERHAALDGAAVLYCKSWCKPTLYGQPEDEIRGRQSLREDWCIDEPWFESARAGAKFMHCLPVRRNVKVSDAVLDGPRSVVLSQAENRLHAQKSILVTMEKSRS